MKQITSIVFTIYMIYLYKHVFNYISKHTVRQRQFLFGHYFGEGSRPHREIQQNNVQREPEGQIERPAT